MTNFILFTNAFLSYLLVFLVFGILILVAVLVGIRVRKSKNNKEEIEASAKNIEEAAVKEEN